MEILDVHLNVLVSFSSPNLALDSGFQGTCRVTKMIFLLDFSNFLYKNRGEKSLSSLIVWKY